MGAPPLTLEEGSGTRTLKQREEKYIVVFFMLRNVVLLPRGRAAISVSNAAAFTRYSTLSHISAQ